MLRPAASGPRVFLTAEWRHLAMLNFELDPVVLEPFLPRHLELDFWNGKTYVSLVGFMFRDTRVLGVPIPFHRNFAELNLRFYVRRRDAPEERRGVIFIREIVPRWAVSFVARNVYQENYLTLPMRHSIESGPQADCGVVVEYAWRFRRRWNRMRIEAAGIAELPATGSLDEFIVDHFWGYCRQRNGECLEYEVEHPPWPIRAATHVELDCDAAGLYGPAPAEALACPPRSAFLVDGSAVALHRGVRLAARPEAAATTSR
ncbi:MAG TPA: DUF2071 domain-containing protein [Pirellulales bacterium]|jgi:uncharacterized protein YqjF (DUF2071 family)|nr:DUF2071 domain-containing protein [Pirellulales bacterium]